MKSVPNTIFFSQVEVEIAAGRSVLFKVKGNSMYPFLRNNKDSVMVSPLIGLVATMDIVLFKFNGNHILHRVVAIEQGRFIIQGDGIYASKEFCTADDIVGIVTKVQRPNGRIISVKSPLWKLFSLLWHSLRFFRRYLLALMRIFYK